MNKLKEYFLKDCIELVIDHRGKTPAKMGGNWVDNGIRVISALNVHNGEIDNEEEIRCVSKEIYKKWMSEDIKREDCFIASEGASLGENCIWDSDEKIVLGQRLYALRTNKAILDPWYFAAYMQTNEFRLQIDQVSTGSTVFGISQPILLNLKVLLPDIEIQRYIGKIYKNIKRKIINNNKIISELESTINTLYNYWFLQFEFPNEDGKPYKSNGGTLVKNEDLGIFVPKDWKVSLLKGKYKIEKGLSYTSEDISSGKGCPMINLACIDRNRNYRVGELKYHNGNIPKKAILKEGDLLIACTDLTRNADIVGCPILTPADGNIYTYSTDISKMIPNEEYFNQYYLYMTLRTDFYHNFIRKWASGTNVLHLNLDGIGWYKTWIPPIELQNKFAELVIDVHKKKSTILKENGELMELRNYLLPLLMNGQVTFKN